MKKLLFLLIVPLCTSCVSSKIFNEIESRYATLKGENASLETAHSLLIKNYDSLRYHYGELVGQYEKQSQLLATTSGTLATLQDAYTALEQNSNEICAIVEKNTISDKPQNDPLAIGVFWFRKSIDFKEIVVKAVEKKLTVNGEYYVANAMNLLLGSGKKVTAFFVDQWVSYGDPFELEMYSYWEDYFWKRDTKRNVK